MTISSPTELFSLRRPTKWGQRNVGVVLLIALLSAGCGEQAASRSSDGSATVPPPKASSQALDLEPATAPGLAEAVMTHLDDKHAKVLGGIQNKNEGWTAADFEVETHGKTVELRLFVASIEETTKRTDPAKTGECPTSPTKLYCRIERVPDGSYVTLEASTEDIVGGEMTPGFSANVGSGRETRRGHYIVLVSEILPTREKAFVEMTGLPVPVEVLKAIATDARLGPRTTPALNRAGKRDFQRLFDVMPG